MEFDLSDEFSALSELSLDDIESEIKNLESLDTKGSISLFGNPAMPLFNYKINGSSVDVDLTETGRKMFTSSYSNFKGVDAITFSHFLGVGAESQADLKKKCGMFDGEIVTPQHVLQLAIDSKRIKVSSNTNSNSRNPDAEELIKHSHVIQSSDLSAKVGDLSLENIIKYGAQRQVSFAYIRNDNTLTPIVIKSSSRSAPSSVRRNEEVMFAFEYASLKAMRAHGLNAVKATIIKDNKNHLFLIEERFDEANKTVVGETTDGLFLSSTSPQKYFSSVTTQKTVQAGSFQNISPEMSAHSMSKTVETNKIAQKQFITARIFNVLIGNIDEHGMNSGLIKTLATDGTVKTALCPFFDITPYLHGNTDDAMLANSKYSEITLAKLDLKAIVKIDQHLNTEFVKNAELVIECFAEAKKIQHSMREIVKTELVERKVLTSLEADEFCTYLDTKLGSREIVSDVPVAKNPFHEKTSMQSFAKKILEKENQNNAGIIAQANI